MKKLLIIALAALSVGACDLMEYTEYEVQVKIQNDAPFSIDVRVGDASVVTVPFGTVSAPVTLTKESEKMYAVFGVAIYAAETSYPLQHRAGFTLFDSRVYILRAYYDAIIGEVVFVCSLE